MPGHGGCRRRCRSGRRFAGRCPRTRKPRRLRTALILANNQKHYRQGRGLRQAAGHDQPHRSPSRRPRSSRPSIWPRTIRTRSPSPRSTSMPTTPPARDRAAAIPADHAGCPGGAEGRSRRRKDAGTRWSPSTTIPKDWNQMIDVALDHQGHARRRSDLAGPAAVPVRRHRLASRTPRCSARPPAT